MCNENVFSTGILCVGDCEVHTSCYIHPACRHAGCMVSHGFEGFLLNRVCVHTGHRSTRWQTHRALVECWFSIGFTRYSVQIRVCPTVGGSSRTVSRAGPLQVFYLISQLFLVISGKPCSDPVGSIFFLPSRKCMFLHIF